MKKILLVIFIIGCSSEKIKTIFETVPTEHKIEGFITANFDSLQIIQNASILIDGKIISSDQSGYFKVENLESGRYTIVLNHDDYFSDTLMINLFQDTLVYLGMYEKELDYFPNTIGYEWEYVFFREDGRPKIFGKKYTKIIRDTLLSSGKVLTIWEHTTIIDDYAYKTKDYIESTSDSIKVHYFYFPNGPQLLYVMPLYVGAKWLKGYSGGSPYYGDVLEKFKVNTQFSMFNDCYQIHSHATGDNYFSNNYYYYVPNVGLVKADLHSYSFSSTKTSIELVKCNFIKSK